MRLSGFSLLGILIALVIGALIAVAMFTAGAPNNGNQGPVGFYQNAITDAQHSVAQQDAAATHTLPVP